jgi:eukaryotic-like serine/threonine-protein kinase
MVGRELSHYRIVAEISRGGMGVVYRATDTRLNRDVALKVLPDELVHDADRRRRFVQEAQAASALEHPHIAVVHEVDEAEGVTFIAMELVRGEKLRDLMERRRLTPARALELATEIAQGLARTHETGIVHRDLKPANVMVTDEGHAKIIDFGLAKLIDPPSALAADTQTVARQATDPGVVLGTVAYMSPEQASGDKVDHRTDVFSFGVLLFEMLAGKAPFGGRTSIDVLHAILNQPVPKLESIGDGISPEAGAAVQRLLDKCLAKDAGDRYQGMRDIVVDLRALRRLLESAPSGAISAVVAPPSASRTDVRSAPAASVESARRSPWILWTAAAAVVAGIAIGIGLYVNRGPAATIASGTRPSVAVMYFENKISATSPAARSAFRRPAGFGRSAAIF